MFSRQNDKVADILQELVEISTSSQVPLSACACSVDELQLNLFIIFCATVSLQYFDAFGWATWSCPILLQQIREIFRAATNLENLEKIRAFDSGEGKVRGSGKSQGKCVLPVVCYRDCDGHRISIA